MEIRVRPGYVSAFYFVLFELFLVPLVDNILSHVVNYLCYRDIYRGTKIDLKSADIPGITACLIGKRYSLLNMLVLIVKCALLAMIFEMDLSIETSEIHNRETRTATFMFNASDSQWENQVHVINRPYSRLQYCRKLDVETGEIIYYSAAFNLENGTVLQNETTSLEHDSSYNVNGSTFQCLGPHDVYDEYVVLNMRVVGCSTRTKYYCTRRDEMTKTWKYEFYTGPFTVSPYAFDRNSFNDSKIGFMNQTIVDEIWSEINSPTLVCLQKNLPGKISSDRPNVVMQTDCLLSGKVSKTETLLEHWRYDSGGKLRRYYAGVVLEGDVDIGKSVRISILWYLSRAVDWEVLSSLLLSYSMVYEPIQRNFTKIGEIEYEVTVIPDFAIPLTVSVVSIAIIIQIVVYFTIGKDRRPRINTINGISSVLREEKQPTGRSLRRGRPATLAWYFDHGRGPRFGPCNGSNDAVIELNNTERFTLRF